MDLKQINSTYETAKKNLESRKKQIESLEKDIKTELDNIAIANAEKIKAQRKGNTSVVNKAEQYIKKHQDNIGKLKEQAQKMQSEMDMFQGKVDKVVEKIKEDPEMKKHLDEVLAKRYSREIKKIEQQKEETLKKKEENTKKLEDEDKKLKSIDNVQKMIDAHPAMQNHMQGMLNASASIDRLNSELSTLSLPKDKTRINTINKEMQDANQKLDKNKKAILDYANKNKLGITEATLDGIMKNIAVNSKGEANIKASLNNAKNEVQANKDAIARQNKKYARELIGYDKQLAHNENAITMLGYKIPGRTDRAETEPGEGTAEPTANGGEKLKFWHFIKRFKQWRENRKTRALPEVGELKEIGEEKDNAFINSMKYGVVKDVADKMQKENLKKAKAWEKSTRQANANERDDENR